jgi:hypothetical protein
MKKKKISLLINLIGQRFGRLIVRKRSPGPPAGKVYWVCDCDCGGMTVVPTHMLKSGATKSCGCLHDEESRERLRIRHLSHFNPAIGWHGKHPLHGIWASMIQRCSDPNKDNYKHYGGRGITVCERWKKFEFFAADIEATIGPRPSLKHSIHRIRNHAGYEPMNVKWATQKEQTAPGNKRQPPLGIVTKTSIAVDGTNLKEACRRAGLSGFYSGILKRIRCKGDTPQKAMAYFEQRPETISLAEACRQAGVSYKSVWFRMKKRGESREPAIAYYEEKRRSKKQRAAR